MAGRCSPVRHICRLTVALQTLFGFERSTSRPGCSMAGLIGIAARPSRSTSTRRSPTLPSPNLTAPNRPLRASGRSVRRHGDLKHGQLTSFKFHHGRVRRRPTLVDLRCNKPRHYQHQRLRGSEVRDRSKYPIVLYHAACGLAGAIDHVVRPGPSACQRNSYQHLGFFVN